MAQEKKTVPQRLAHPSYWQPLKTGRNARQYELSEKGLRKNNGVQMVISRRRWLEYVRSREGISLEEQGKRRAQHNIPRGTGRGRFKSPETEMARHIHYINVPHEGYTGVLIFEYRDKKSLDKAINWLRKNFRGYAYWVRVKADTIHFDWNDSPPDRLVRDTRIVPYYDLSGSQMSQPNKARKRVKSAKFLLNQNHLCVHI